METKKNELAVKKEEETNLVITPDEMDEMFGESSLDMTTGLSFNVVKIVRETAQFDVGNDNYVKSLTGHVLFKHRAAQWWRTAFDDRQEGDNPMPQCYSIDGVKPCGGEDVQSDLCITCKYDEYGSAPKEGGKGKACRNTLRLLFLQDDAVLPIVLAAPPTSLNKKGPLQRWLNGVPNDVAAAYNAVNIHTKKGGPFVDSWPAHVELTLEKKVFGDMTASILCINTLDVITPKSDPVKIQQLFSMMKEATEVYKSEQTSYIENDRSNEDTAPQDSSNADIDDDDEVPI